MRGLQTTVRVVSPHGRGSKKALAYFLGLNKKALISSLKSATNTEASAMNKLSMSIMDFLYVDSAHRPNLITKKKAQLPKRKLGIPHTRLFKPFLNSTYQMDKSIITQKGHK
ncbi:hypothetical protein ACTVZV_001783 [Campylobacter upsaliensis]